MRTISRILLGIFSVMAAQMADAANEYISGRIVTLSFVGADVYIKVHCR